MPGLLLATESDIISAGENHGLFIFPIALLVETLAIFLFFKIVLKEQIGLNKILLMSLVANAVSYGLGKVFSVGSYPFGNNPFNLLNLGANLSHLAILFISTVLFEWGVFIAFFHSQSIWNLKKALQAAFTVNLASFLILIGYLFFISVAFPEASILALRQTRLNMGDTLNAEKKFYLENSRFASTLEELGLEFFAQPDTQELTKLYDYQVSGDRRGAIATATPKTPTPRKDGLRSYTGVVFLVKEKPLPEFVSGICETAKLTNRPPEQPLLSGDKIQCPPGSSLVVIEDEAQQVK